MLSVLLALSLLNVEVSDSAGVAVAVADSIQLEGGLGVLFVVDVDGSVCLWGVDYDGEITQRRDDDYIYLDVPTRWFVRLYPDDPRPLPSRTDERYSFKMARSDPRTR